MKVICSLKKMQKLMSALKGKKQIGFVPTMGYLHEGHLRLVKAAKKKSEVVVVSIFVNPTQFGPKEDLSRYPRNKKSDLEKLKKLGVDYVFFPNTKNMYPDDFQTWIDVTKVSRDLCGASRPGHFRGVATVVLKLFNIVQPDFAFFGKKDYQQLQVIKTMVRDLNLPVKVFGIPIVREKDGLAMSSRNAYLNTDERKMAVSLFRGLKAVKKASQKKKLTCLEVKNLIKKELPQHKNIKIDYIECRHAETLESLQKILPKKTLVALAVFIGKTRLIDNIVI